MRLSDDELKEAARYFAISNYGMDCETPEELEESWHAIERDVEDGENAIELERASWEAKLRDDSEYCLNIWRRAREAHGFGGNV